MLMVSEALGLFGRSEIDELLIDCDVLSRKELLKIAQMLGAKSCSLLSSPFALSSLLLAALVLLNVVPVHPHVAFRAIASLETYLAG